jgi:hypothetical protein
MCGQVEEKEGASGVERGGGGGDQNPIAAGADGALREQGKEPAADWRSWSKKNEINSNFEIDNWNILKLYSFQKWLFQAPKSWNKIWSWRFWAKEQLSL